MPGHVGWKGSLACYLILALACSCPSEARKDSSKAQESDSQRGRSQHLHTLYDVHSSKQPKNLHKVRPEQLKWAKGKGEYDPKANVIHHVEKQHDFSLPDNKKAGHHIGKQHEGALPDNKAAGNSRTLLALEDTVSAVGEVLADSAVQVGRVEGGAHLVEGDKLAGEAKALVEDMTSPDRLDGSGVKISWGTVFWMTMLMGSAAGLGSLPFFCVGSLSKEWAALANALACGVMLACSFDLVHEGQPYGGGFVILGIVFGALFISASQKFLEDFEDVRFQGLQGINARKILLMIGIMAAHAFGEGAGVGVSFCGDRGLAQGVLVTLAIGLHNIPEGLAVSTVLVARGIKPSKALLWTLFTAMPQPLVAVPAFLFVDAFQALLPVALGFAAGCMVWMVFAELLPDALADASHGKVATTATFAAAWLEGLRMLLATFETEQGGFVIPPGISGRLLGWGVLIVALCALSGTVGGVVSRVLVKSSSTGLGFAGGVLTWEGLQLLGSIRKSSAGSTSFAPAALVLACGGLSAYLLKSFILPLALTPDDQEKEKEGGTPKKETSGFLHAPDLETGLVAEKRVFQPYKNDSTAQYKPTIVGTGLLVMTGIAMYRGHQVSRLGSRAMTGMWLPMTIWSLLPGMLFAASVKGSKAGGRKWWIAAFSSTAALMWFATEFHTALAPSSKGLSDNFAFYLSGMALASGLGLLLPLARRQNWKRCIAGMIKGLVTSVIVEWLISLASKHFGTQ